MTGSSGYVILRGALFGEEGIRSLNVTGVILQLAYRLRRHECGVWSLGRWIGLLWILAMIGALIYWWPQPWPVVLLGVLFLGYLAVLRWASWRGYVHFEAATPAAARLHNPSASPPLRPEELVPVRASGWFTVEGKNQYYMDLEADYESVATREHIVLGRVHPSRFLVLGQWPVHELGWWYIFFRPATIRRIEAGTVHFGSESRHGLQVVYAPDEETEQTVYLTCNDVEGLRRIWTDLLLDAPAGVALSDPGDCSGD